MESLLHSTEEDQNPSKLSEQMIRFTLHTLVALAIWVGLMMAGYAGYIINRFRQDDMAPVVWLIGLIWLLIISLWILDMPTGPNECYKCEAGEKLVRTFFSFPMPSGLIDDDGPFIGTWPAAALLGYSIGARLALKKIVVEED
jgi:hypothetical protein